MTVTFEDIIYKQDLLKARILFGAAAICDFVFYYFMSSINPQYVDFIPGRIAIILTAVIGLALACSIKNISLIWLRVITNLTVFLYLGLYAYLIYLNQWSVFHRWSYFVVLSIVSTALLTWKDYVGLTVVGFVIPVIIGFLSPLSATELWHFHLANMATLVVIGVSIRSNFHYRQESFEMTLRLVEHSKMLALGEMSAGVSHEINNPLAILMSNVTLIENQVTLDQVDQNKVINYLQKITRSAQRIANIVLALQRISSSDNNEVITSFDLRDILVESLDLYHEKLKSLDITLIHTTTDVPQICLCRKFQIMQIMTNLLNNAIEGSLKSNDKKEIQIGFENTPNDRKIRLSVSDSGPGVPLNVEDKIMQLFFTTKDIGKGRGLGLAISIGIAKSHGGRLYLNSKTSRSCFTLELPRTH